MNSSYYIQVYFVVMQSILYPDERIDVRYDLKACSAGRLTKDKTDDTECVTILKDVNFGSRIIQLGEPTLILVFMTEVAGASPQT